MCSKQKCKVVSLNLAHPVLVKEDLLSVVIAGGGRTSTVLDSPSRSSTCVPSTSHARRAFYMHR